MNVYIVGRGKLAQALLAGLEGNPFGSNLLDNKLPRALIHAGSGREMPQALAYCAQHRLPLIQASTGIQTPKNPPFPYIEAPNLALDVLRFIEAAALFKGASITLTESHQAQKTTTAGTAKLIAQRLGLHEITSIRDPKVQKSRFHIDEKDLNSHALHELQIQRAGVDIRFEVRVRGLEPYIAGAKELLKMDLESLAEGIYSLSELAAIKKSADNIAAAH